jgi:hypothetical protein
MRAKSAAEAKKWVDAINKNLKQGDSELDDE